MPSQIADEKEQRHKPDHHTRATVAEAVNNSTRHCPFVELIAVLLATGDLTNTGKLWIQAPSLLELHIGLF